MTRGFLSRYLSAATLAVLQRQGGATSRDYPPDIPLAAHAYLLPPV